MRRLTRGFAVWRLAGKNQMWKNGFSKNSKMFQMLWARGECRSCFECRQSRWLLPCQIPVHSCSILATLCFLVVTQLAASLAIRGDCDPGQGTLFDYHLLRPTPQRWGKTVVVVGGSSMGTTALLMALNCGISPGCGVTRGNGLVGANNPHVFVTGENGLILWDLHEFSLTVEKNYRDHSQTWDNGVRRIDDPTSPWYAVPPPSVTLEAMGELVARTMTQGRREARIVGFKEIRWMQRSDYDPDRIHAFFHWLSSYVPALRVVTITRQCAAVVPSRERRGLVGDDCERDVRTLTGLSTKLNRAGIPSHALTYEENIKTQNLTSLFRFLGEEYEQERITKVLNVRAKN